MHLPYPSPHRKTSTPSTPSFFFPTAGLAPFQGRRLALPRRYRRHALTIGTFVAIALVWLVYLRGGNSSRYPGGGGPVGHANHVPAGTPPAVIVTVLDEKRFGTKYTELLKENRRLYAERNGYTTFFPQVGDYDLARAPKSWTKVVALRHALTLHPDAGFLWFVDADTLIMNPAVALARDVLPAAALDRAMLRERPVVPPDSLIKTFGHLRGADVDLVLTQDAEGLVTSSFVLRNSEWARFFLETWFDPLYRSYNFQKAETHALEHIVQWHPTILSKMALVPQRTINSYARPHKGEEYQPGDLTVRFTKCSRSAKSPTCEAEAEPYMAVWKTAYRGR